jgi:hypothetical protein
MSAAVPDLRPELRTVGDKAADIECQVRWLGYGTDDEPTAEAARLACEALTALSIVAHLRASKAGREVLRG